jgi:hypothetical protein
MKPEEEEVLDHAVEKALKELHYPGFVTTDWRGEDWFNFHWIANEIAEQQGISRGVAERTLRELCATGDVRSIKANGQDEKPDEPEIIRPREWVEDQVDLTVGEEIWVFVSAGDIQYWLHKQAEASGRPSKELVPPIGRTSRKLRLARIAVKHLWPEGPPEELTNPQIEKQVDEWITVYCKKNNQPKPDIGRDTVLRAAGRRR